MAWSTLRAQHGRADGAHPWQVMDGGDTASQRFIADELTRARPDDAVLSEEGLEDPRRFTWTGSGSSIRSTARASTASRGGRTGRCTSRCGTTATSWPGPWACRRSALSFATDPAPVAAAVERERPRARDVAIAGAVRRGRRRPRPRRRGRALGSAGAKAMSVVTGDDRHLRPRRRHVPVGLGRAGGRGARRRPARQPHRRVTDRLQRPRSVAARLARCAGPSWPSRCSTRCVGMRRSTRPTG